MGNPSKWFIFFDKITFLLFTFCLQLQADCFGNSLCCCVQRVSNIWDLETYLAANQMNGCKSNIMDSCCFTVVFLISVVIKVVFRFSDMTLLSETNSAVQMKQDITEKVQNESKKVSYAKKKKARSNLVQQRLSWNDFYSPVWVKLQKHRNPTLPIMQLNSVSLLHLVENPCFQTGGNLWGLKDAVVP